MNPDSCPFGGSCFYNHKSSLDHPVTLRIILCRTIPYNPSPVVCPMRILARIPLRRISFYDPLSNIIHESPNLIDEHIQYSLSTLLY